MTFLEWLCLPWRREFLTPDGLNSSASVSNRQAQRSSNGGLLSNTVQTVPNIQESPRVDPASVEIRNLSFAYPTGPTVLKAISLDIKPREVFCILGKSGCGKSTLLRLLAGLETQFDGAIFINGAAPETKRSDVAMAFQHASLFPWKTAARNIRFVLHSRLSEDVSADQVSDSALSLVGLLHKASVYPYQLSGGQQQRVAMARAIACRPSLVLLDEPLSSLDNYTRETLQNEISALLHRSGITTVLVTHDIAEAIFMSDRIALMPPEGGRIERIFDIPQPRPRLDTFRADESFTHLHSTIWAKTRSMDFVSTS
jgi:ABC-type nitrate/sulfonate/bicarbonate transport system ATPase subunit